MLASGETNDTHYNFTKKLARSFLADPAMPAGISDSSQGFASESTVQDRTVGVRNSCSRIVVTVVNLSPVGGCFCRLLGGWPSFDFAEKKNYIY